MSFPKLNWQRFLIAAGISLCVPLLALAVSQRAAACGGGPAMEGGKMPPYLRSVNLSEAQRDKVFEIMHGQAPVMRDKAKAARNAEAALRQLVISPDYSDSKAQVLADSAARAMAEMSLARAKSERLVYEVLTPEQRKQVAERKAFDEPPMAGRGDGPRRGERGDHGGEPRQLPGR